MKTFTLIFLSILLLLNASAQSTFCPPNVDFENGTFANWQLYTGSCCPISTPTLSGAVFNRHTIMSGTVLDPYGGFPVIAPGNGLYSMKIGNSLANGQAERARYYVKVPAGTGKQILIYRYAVVFEDPKHDPADQPRFEVKAYDSATNAIISCNEHTYISSSNLPGFYRSTVDTEVYYRPWSTASINLTGYGGKTVAIDFAVGDCRLLAHFGYGYVDVNCGLFQLDAKHCNSSGLITFKGPPGFAKYTWMDSALTTVIDTFQTINIPVPQLTTTYALITTPYSGLGCADTFLATYNVATDNINADANADTTICYNTKAKLNVSSTNTNGPFIYKWWPNVGLNCTNCSSPLASPPTTQTYKVYIENYYGCRDTDEVVVTVRQLPNGMALKDTVVCGPNTISLSGSGGTSYKWFPATNVVNPNVANTQANVTASTIYKLQIKDSVGCADTEQVVITVKTVPVANAGNDTAVCLGEKIILNGFGGGTYSWWPSTGLSDTAIATPLVNINSVTSVSYRLTVFDNGCSDTDTVNVVVNPIPVADAGKDTTLCAELQLQLNGTGGSSYQWGPPIGLSNIFIANPTLNTSVSTNYKLVVTNSFNCKDTDDVMINVNPKPVANAGMDPVICLGQKINLNGAATGNYNWWPSAGLSDATILNPLVDINVAATVAYRLISYNAAYCSDTDTVNVVVNPIPIADAGKDTTLCAGLPLQLNGSGGNTYKWIPSAGLSNPNIANPSLITNVFAHYMLVVANSFNCKDTDDVMITVNPKPIASAGNDTAVCQAAVIKLKGSGGGQYHWSPAGQLSDPAIADPVVHANATATFKLVVSNGYGCQDSAIVNIMVAPKPLADAGPDTTVCALTMIQLQGKGGGSYSWSPTVGMSGASTANPTVIANTEKTYALVVTTPLGCSDTDEVKVASYPLPIANAGPDTGACYGNLVQLTGAGGGTYYWYPEANLLNAHADTPVVSVIDNETFYLAVEDMNGCRDTDKVVVTLFPDPVANAGNDSTVCPGASIKLFAKGGTVFQWYPETGLSDAHIQSPQLNVSGPCEYYVVVENQYGCADTDAVAFNVIPFEPEAGPDKEICLYDTVQLNASGGHAYFWNSIASLEIAHSSSPIVWPQSTSLYTVMIQDTFCKREEIMGVNVIVNPLPALDIVATEKDCGKNTGMLVASGAIDYIWEPAIGLADPNAAVTAANPIATTRYFLTGTNIYGCKDTMSAEVKVFDGDGRVFLPDAFTPNGDGINDCYRAIIPGDITKFNLRIFNRFGEMVFEADDIHDCWDGTYKGQLAELATYFYYYTATSSLCGEIYKQGDMHLIR